MHGIGSLGIVAVKAEELHWRLPPKSLSRTLVLRIGIVRGVEWYEGKEGAVRVTANEVRGGVREDVGRVALDSRRRGADMHIVASVIGVRVVVAVS